MKNFTLLKRTGIFLLIVFYMNTGFAQCGYGDETTYGEGQWIGYVYTGLDSNNPPAYATDYQGYISRSEIFDQNIGGGSLSAGTMCGSFDSSFWITYKMQQTFTAGYYTFTVGADDGYRLSFDGGTNFAADLSDWADHGYQTKTTTYYLSGTVNLVYEYYERGGDSRVSFTYAVANCNSTAPTAITGNTTVSCHAETTLTATGGTAGTNSYYQWGTGTVIGENIISGQTNASITVSPSYDTYYWVRRVNASPCSGYSGGTTVLVSISNPPPGNPEDFGDNIWNVYTYSGTDLDLIDDTYLGYYTQETLGFDTQLLWPKAESPESYSGWQGCPVPYDYFTFVHKREGFPCGRYVITMVNWDDASRLYINGEQVWSHVDWSGGTGSEVIGTYDLNENSTIELRTEENGGDANAAMSIVETDIATAPTSISGNNIFCSKSSTTLTANGGTLGANGAYQWGTGETGNNILDGETGSSIAVTPSETTTYWVRIANTNCGTHTTAATFTVTVPEPVVYNGSWSSIPNIDTAVIIEADMTINEDMEMCSCQVSNNAIVSVAEGVDITLTGKLIVDENASFTLENTASLLQTDDVQNEGDITVTRNSSKIMRLDYTVWSSPVAGQQLQEFSPMTLQNRFYTLNTAENIFYTTPASEDFELAAGYLIRAPNNHPTTPTIFTGTFTGIPHNGTVTKTLEYTGTDKSFTAVGNPYPSPIDAHQFINENSDIIEGTLWFWRKTNDPDETTYCTLTTLGFTANTAPGGTNEYSYDPNGILNTGQGFFVNTIAEGSITFTNTIRLGNSSNQFFRAPNEESTLSRLWLNLTDTENGNFSQIMVGYTPQATTGYDNTIDGRSLADGPLQLYSLLNDGAKLAIQGRPAFENADIVDIGYTATTNGQMKFEIDHADGIFAGEKNIYIRDNFLDITHDISESSYIFASEEGTFNDRFKIVYTTEALGTDFVNNISESIIVYYQDKKIKVHASQAIKIVTLHDLTGRALYKSDHIDNNEFSSTDLYTAQQVIIAHVTLQDGTIISKKIMVD